MNTALEDLREAVETYQGRCVDALRDIVMEYIERVETENQESVT